MTLPLVSVNVTRVLLKVDWTNAKPVGMFLRSLLRPRGLPRGIALFPSLGLDVTSWLSAAAPQQSGERLDVSARSYSSSALAWVGFFYGGGPGSN
jgi:hypothetical protein